ncbi:MAG: hypothetical protein LBH43_11770 [Treponema sp.]|jgi:hypothetical protein|nr:hypothetical protein [Treponema sp.]
MKSKRILAVALLLSIVVAGVVSAQGVDVGTSPQAQGTAGRFKSDADLYMAPDSYTAVEFDKYFAFASYGNNKLAQLGYATRLSDLYLGLAYQGNLFVGLQSQPYMISDQGSFKGSTDKEVKTYPYVSPMNGADNVNNAAVLVGVGDMGIKLTYKSHYQKWNPKEFVAAGTDYKSYLTEYGDINPILSWGMTKGLLDAGVQPWVDLGFNFHRDYAIRETYTGTTANEPDLIKSNNSTLISLGLGAGGYDLFEGSNGLSWWADLEYYLDLKMYSNEFQYTKAGKRELGKINGLGMSEMSANKHELDLYLGTGWKGEKVASKLVLILPFVLDNSTDRSMRQKGGVSDTADLEQDGSEDKTSTFSFTPTLKLGTMWDLNDKLSVGLGGVVKFNLAPMTTINSEDFTAGTADTDSKSKLVVYGEWDPTANSGAGGYSTHPETSVEFSVSFTLRPSQNLFIEACAGVDANNALEFFGTNGNGLGSFSQILVGVKF